jgi:hypothetical protein
MLITPAEEVLLMQNNNCNQLLDYSRGQRNYSTGRTVDSNRGSILILVEVQLLNEQNESKFL